MSKVPVSPLTGNKYNFVPSKVQHVHPAYSAHHQLIPMKALPTSVSFLSSMPGVYDQGQEGSCTAFSYKEVREFLSINYVKKATVLSAQFQYYCERLLNGDVGQDNGSTVSTAMVSGQIFGTCPDSDEPYTTPFTTKPTKKDFADASFHRIGKAFALNTLADMKNALAGGFVFQLGFLVYASFESASTTATGIMTMPAKSEQILGGHAVCVWGYNDAFTFPGLPKGALCVRNSWGSGWGNNGNFFMPYGYLTGQDPNGNGPYVSDCHMCHLGPNWT